MYSFVCVCVGVFLLSYLYWLFGRLSDLELQKQKNSESGTQTSLPLQLTDQQDAERDKQNSSDKVHTLSLHIFMVFSQ